MALNNLYVKIGANAREFLVAMKSASTSAKFTSKSVKEAEGRFYSLQTQLQKADYGSARWQKLKTDMSAARGEMEKLRKEAGLMNKGGGGIGGLLGKGAALAGGALAGVGAGQIGMSVATQVFDFEQSLANLKAISGATGDELQSLEKTARNLGASTSFTAAQVVDLQTELSKLGFTVPEVESLSGSVVNLATALDADAGEAAVILGGQLRAFGKDASHAAEFAEILGATANRSAVDFDDFALMLPKVSKAASEVGWDFAQLNAALGILRDQNIRAESAGTGLRNVLLKNAEAGRTYKQGLELISGSTDKLKTATELYGAENAIVALTLSKMNKEVDISAEKIRGMTGVLAEMNQVKLDTVQGQVKLLKSAFAELILTLNNGSSIKGFVSMIGESVKGLTQLAKHGGIFGKDFDDKIEFIADHHQKLGKSYAAMIAEGKMSTAEFISMIDKQIAAKEKSIAQYPKARAEIKATFKAQLEGLRQLKKTALDVGGLGNVATEDESASASPVGSTSTSAGKSKATPASIYRELNRELAITKQHMDFIGHSADYATTAAELTEKAIKEIFQTGAKEAKAYAEKLKAEIKGMVAPSRQGHNLEAPQKIDTLEVGVSFKAAMPDDFSEKFQTGLSLISNLDAELASIDRYAKLIPGEFDAMGAKLAAAGLAMQEGFAADIPMDQLNELIKKYGELYAASQLLVASQQFAASLASSAEDSFGSLASGAATAEEALGGFGKAAIAAGLDALKGQLLAAIGGQTKWAAKLGPFGIPIAAAAIGAIFGLAKGALTKTKGVRLAEGGIAYGRTMAEIGEYSGASHNPEVIAPLDKLTSIMKNAMGSGGQQAPGPLEFVIRGDQLVTVMANAQRKMTKFGR